MSDEELYFYQNMMKNWKSKEDNKSKNRKIKKKKTKAKKK